MKTKSAIKSTSIAATLGLALLLPGVQTGAQEPRYSSKPWIPMKRIETSKDFEALPKSAQIAMACAKCKSVVVTIKSQLTTKPSGGTVEQALMVHQCPGCGGTMTVRGDKQSQMIHTCSKCGDDSAFCCATTKDTKGTKGMDKK